MNTQTTTDRMAEVIDLGTARSRRDADADRLSDASLEILRRRRVLLERDRAAGLTVWSRPVDFAGTARQRAVVIPTASASAHALARGVRPHAALPDRELPLSADPVLDRLELAAAGLPTDGVDDRPLTDAEIMLVRDLAALGGHLSSDQDRALTALFPRIRVAAGRGDSELLRSVISSLWSAACRAAGADVLEGEPVRVTDHGVRTDAAERGVCEALVLAVTGGDVTCGIHAVACKRTHQRMTDELRASQVKTLTSAMTDVSQASALDPTDGITDVLMTAGGASGSAGWTRQAGSTLVPDSDDSPDLREVVGGLIEETSAEFLAGLTDAQRRKPSIAGLPSEVLERMISGERATNRTDQLSDLARFAALMAQICVRRSPDDLLSRLSGHDILAIRWSWAPATGPDRRCPAEDMCSLLGLQTGGHGQAIWPAVRDAAGRIVRAHLAHVADETWQAAA